MDSGLRCVATENLDRQRQLGARNLGLKTEGGDIEKFQNVVFGLCFFLLSYRMREASF